MVQSFVGCDALRRWQQRPRCGVGINDRRAVLCRRGRAMPLSRDHKPSTPSESARVAEAGGAVSPDGLLDGARTGGVLVALELGLGLG